MNRFVNAVLWLYARLLRVYPRGMRAAFGDELLAIFSLRLRDAQAHGPLAVAGVLWAELRDLPGIITRAGSPGGNGRPFWPARAAALAAMAPFLINALMQAVHGLTRTYPALATFTSPWLGWLALGTWALVLLAGVARGLPHWSLPSVGIVLGISALVLNGGGTVAGVPLHWHIRYPIWVGWVGQVVLPLLAVLALMLVVCAALPWLRPLSRRLRDDWTLLSFALYGFMFFALEMLDMHPYETPLTVVGLLILAGGAWAYMRAATVVGRLLALGGAVTLMMAEAAFGQVLLTTPEWHLRFSAWRNLDEALAGWLWLMGALLAPALLALLPGRAAPAAPATPDAGAAPPGDEPSDMIEDWAPEAGTQQNVLALSRH